MPPSTRQYHSRNRQRPCDRCRQQKLRCQTRGEEPCRRCQSRNIRCTFSGKGDPGTPTSSPTLIRDVDKTTTIFASPQNRAARQSDSPSQLRMPDAQAAAGAIPIDTDVPRDANPEDEAWAANPPQIAPLFTDQYLSTQISQSLDKVDGHYYQLFGSSSEGDPWLLRHCRYDELGYQRFMKAHFRNAGGVPTRNKIPAHFMVAEESLCGGSRDETSISRGKDLRAELAHHVPASCGGRLVRLFMKRVFPVLPIISRTELDLLLMHGIPDPTILDKIPTHLLGAIYGSALPFAFEDDRLSLLVMYEKPPVSRIWRIVYEIILDEIHKPHLSVLQAALLYMHRHLESEKSYAVPDTAFSWSFMGMVVGLAHSLGLNLECHLFAIPAQEKRIRRRLWWAVYTEDKFLSIMLGRPPYIRPREWDVEELEDKDFMIDHQFESHTADINLPFRDMARLALIAEEVQENLYSLKSSQVLAENMAASIETAKPLFHRLSTWRESLKLPKSGQLPNDVSPSAQPPCPATLYNAYLTLVVCTWRALLRATVRSSEPPQVINIEDPLDPGHSFVDSLSWDFTHFPEIDLRPHEDKNDNGTAVGEVHEAALSCASTVVDFVSKLDSSVISEFWHSYSRTSFALITNFMVLLLVQAPDLSKAIKANQILGRWKQALDIQSKISPLFLLAKIRLVSYYSVGLEETFHLPPHVQQALQQPS